MKKLGEDFVNEYPIGSMKILSDFYMDDLISGSNTENGIFEIYKQVSNVLDTANFTLRKWFSNSRHFNSFVPDADKEKTLLLNDEEIIKTLGIIWAPTGDTFRYVWPNLDNSKPINKRRVLAELSKLFDPLGIINPVIVKGKIFMQDLWILKVNWDESLPLNLHSHFNKSRENLKDMGKIIIPRFVLAEKQIAGVEIHGFTDASKRVYGCCIYIRSICEDNDITVHLWIAKSRVAPLKTQTLPRIELMGGELLSELVSKTKANFPFPIDGTYLWTDSEIVLDWLNEHPSNWKTFVANKVSCIQEITKSCIWRHVPSKANPADIISRGVYVNELTNSFWFSGPDFLKKPYSDCPPNKCRKRDAGVDMERNCSVALSVELSWKKNVRTYNSKSDILKWMESVSDFEKLQRVVVKLLTWRRDSKQIK